MDALHRLTHEPHWRPRSQLWRYTLPPVLREWLLDTSSLTRRLQARCSGTFSVAVLEQAYRGPSAQERRVLGLRPGTWALVRQVHLTCGGTPWVFARTVVPIRSLKGRGRALARLGRRPLGEVLFSDPHLRRGEPEVAPLTPDNPLYALAAGNSAADRSVWGRRSRFLIGRKPLLVSEFFLPEFIVALEEARDDAHC